MCKNVEVKASKAGVEGMMGLDGVLVPLLEIRQSRQAGSKVWWS
jgi:hypothetical protein